MQQHKRKRSLALHIDDDEERPRESETPSNSMTAKSPNAFPRWLEALLGILVVSIFLSRSYVRMLLPFWSLDEAQRGLEAMPTEALHHNQSSQQRIALLMSFPNSGTSYTLMNTQELSTKSVASNYEKEVRELPAHHIRPSPLSPYVLNHTLGLPGSAMLTKTHCGGFCESCLPIDNATSFDASCRTVANLREEGEVIRLQPYSPDWIERAVHLIRSPFDNLVARMHLGIKRRKSMKKQWSEDDLSAFQDTPDGLLAWCDYIDTILKGDFEKYMKDAFGMDRYDEEMQRFLDLPCRTEWLRYVQWHNFAIDMLDKLEIDVHALYYEDYTSQYKSTVKSLMHFLQLPALGGYRDFTPGKTYTQLYNRDVTLRAKAFVKRIASPKCWDLIRHYFEADWIVQGMEQTHVAWLLSFPNSGTSYTMMNTQRMTNASTATNHGQEVRKPKTATNSSNNTRHQWGKRRANWWLKPVRPDVAPGPFLLQPHRTIPQSEVLTKTHCFGFCFSCGPSDNLEHFREACFRATASSNKLGFRHFSYDHEANRSTTQRNLVKKSVHLIRNPFDNLVSRMHHGLQHAKKMGLSIRKQQKITDDANGLREWCRFTDNKFAASEWSRFYVEEVDASLQQFTNADYPCHADWIRYTQWHNYADMLLHDVLSKRDGVQTMHLFYENYTTNYNETVGELLRFLNMTQQDTPVPFESHKTYRHFFTKTQARRAKQLVQHIATPRVWGLLRHYFENETEFRNDNETFVVVAQNQGPSRLVELDKRVVPPLLPGYNNHESNNTTNLQLPEIAWLMSFPNSGTSFTMAAYRRLTNTTGVTNYAQEVRSDGPIVPVGPAGPFLLEPAWNLPGRTADSSPYWLAKTHCIGYCDACSIKPYTVLDFELGCRRTLLNRHASFYYPASVPKRAIHIFRHPLDNLVARKHLGFQILMKAKRQRRNATMGKDTHEGIVAWCEYLDKAAFRSRLSSFNETMKADLQQVPCGAEIYRYVQWHNLAMQVTGFEGLDIPVHILHYEDYQNNLVETASEIIKFLNISLHLPIAESLDFVSGKSYIASYQADHARRLMDIVRRYAAPQTWQHLKRYYTATTALPSPNSLEA